MSYSTISNIQPLNPNNPVLLLNQKIDYLNSGFQQPSSIPSLTNITGGAHTYTAAELLNRYTTRSALPSNPVTDTMPIASQIVTALNNYQTNNQHSYLTRGTPINTGFYFDWTLKNNDTTNTLVVNGNTGVTFLYGSSLTVLPSSYAVLRITVTNVSSPAVTVTALSNTSSGSTVTDVSNVAALKALNVTYIPDGSLIRTTGYYTANDGGQGTYIYNSSSTATDNGGTVIQPTTGSGRFLLLLINGQINVKQFGAISDGITDNIPMFNRAIKFINDQSGGTLLIPDGNFAVDVSANTTGEALYTKSIYMCSNLTVTMTADTIISVIGTPLLYIIFSIAQGGTYGTPTNIVINGNGGTLIGYNPNNKDDLVLLHGIFQSDNTSNVTISNLNITNCGTCAKFNGTNINVNNCVFTNANNTCAAVTNGTNVNLTNCKFTGCSAPPGGNAVQSGLDVEANAGESVNGISIINCIFANNGKKGLFIQNGAGSTTNVIVQNCIVYNNGDYGLAVSGSSSGDISNVVVANNRIYDNGTNSINNASQLLVSTVNNGTITGNAIRGNSSSFGIRLPFLKNSLVSNNSVVGAGGSGGSGNNQGGIQLTSSTDVILSGNIVNGGAKYGLILFGGSGYNITNNYISQTGEELVQLRGDVTEVQFSGNVFAEPCLTTGGQYIVTLSTEQVGFISFNGNRFTECLKYNAGTVAAYTAGPPTTITLGTLANETNEYYTGYYVLVGSSRILITAYNGSTRVATLTSAFGTPPTPGTSTYRIVPNRSVNIGINSANSGNRNMYFNGQDFFNSGVSVPFYGVSGDFLNPTWMTSQSLSVSASYTATLFDEVILVDATSASRTITLPSVAQGRCMNKIYTIKKIDSSVNTVIIDGNGTETIDGALTQTISTQWGSITIRGNLTDWSITAVK